MSDSSDITGELNEEICVKWTSLYSSFFPEETGEYIESPEFSFKNTKWRLVLYPNGEHAKQSSGWVGLYIRVEYTLTPEYTVKVKVGIEKRGKKASHKGYMTSAKRGGSWGTSKLMKSDEIKNEGYFDGSDEELIVFCYIYSGENKRRRNKSADVASQAKVVQSDIAESMRKMFLSKLNSDVVIKVNDQELRAHNFILKSRCPLFAAKNENGLIIADSEYDIKIYKNFLLYLYTEQVEEISLDNVFNLHALAEEYGVKDLKTDCVEFLTQNISTDTICDVLTFAENYDETEMMKTAKMFFVGNPKAIVSTDKWRSFISDHPTLVSELVMEMVS